MSNKCCSPDPSNIVGVDKMSKSSEYSDEQLIAFKEKEQRDHIFNILGIISATIFVIVFVIAKWQN